MDLIESYEFLKNTYSKIIQDYLMDSLPRSYKLFKKGVSIQNNFRYNFVATDKRENQKAVDLFIEVMDILPCFFQETTNKIISCPPANEATVVNCCRFGTKLKNYTGEIKEKYIPLQREICEFFESCSEFFCSVKLEKKIQEQNNLGMDKD